MEELEVELIKESEGKYECALVDDEGKVKHKFSFQFTEEDVLDMTEGLIYMKEIREDILYRKLKQQIAIAIMDECGEYAKQIDYEALCRYDNSVPGSIAISLSNFMEQHVYEYFNDIYHLNKEQLEEIKKFYQEKIDLNLVIEKNENGSIFGSKMLSAEEMRKIREAKEQEWLNERQANKNDTFKESVRYEGTIEHNVEQKENDTNIGTAQETEER